MTADSDLKKRRLLLRATTAFGAVGLGGAAIPFVSSMSPSARARAAGGPVIVEPQRIPPGGMLTVEWRGKPVWVLKRTPAMLASLKQAAPLLLDPNSDVVSQQPAYTKNGSRAIKPEVFVAVGLCTHLGCVPATGFTPGAGSGYGDDWPGGFFCPCHGSKFDLAGRVFRNVPAPTNLVIPPHRYLASGAVEIGEEEKIT